MNIYKYNIIPQTSATSLWPRP